MSGYWLRPGLPRSRIIAASKDEQPGWWTRLVCWLLMGWRWRQL